MDTTANISGSMVLKGILLILFGAAAVFWPGLTLLTFVYIFSALLLINGVLDLVFGIGRLVDGANLVAWNRFLLVLFGVIQIGVGVYLLRHPEVGFTTFALLIAFVFLIRGIFEIVDGLFEEREGLYRGVMVIAGVLAALAGIAFVWILGVYALIAGPLLIALALDMNRLAVPARVPRSRTV